VSGPRKKEGTPKSDGAYLYQQPKRREENLSLGVRTFLQKKNEGGSDSESPHYAVAAGWPVACMLRKRLARFCQAGEKQKRAKRKQKKSLSNCGGSCSYIAGKKRGRSIRHGSFFAMGEERNKSPNRSRNGNPQRGPWAFTAEPVSPSQKAEEGRIRRGGKKKGARANGWWLRWRGGGGGYGMGVVLGGMYPAAFLCPGCAKRREIPLKRKKS